MSDQPNQNQNSLNLEELDFLKDSGEDVSDLMPDLEAALQALKSDAPDPAPRQEQTQSQQDRSSYEDWQLPINDKGEDVKLEKRPDPAPTDPASQSPQANQRVTQEQALDPYAADAPRQKPVDQSADKPEGEQGQKPQGEDEFEPGEVTVDAEGKLRDAKTGKYVPHQALHAERVKHKETREEAQKLREENARAQERLNLLTQIMEGSQNLQNNGVQDQQPQEEHDIDPEQDIFGAYAQLKKRHDSLASTVTEIKNQTTQQSQEMKINDSFRQDVVRFAQAQPDFTEAWRYLIDSRKNELQEMGFTNQQAIDAQLGEEQKMMVRKAYKDGKSPASVFYNMARHRGWKAPEKKVETPAPTPAQINQMTQQQPAQNGQQAPQVNQQAAQQIQNAQRSMQANASLSGAGGSAGAGLTIKQLAEMDEDAFVDLVARVGRKKFDSLLS